MTNSVARLVAPALVGLAAFGLSSCGSGVGNAAPRFSFIPNQTIDSGKELSVDLTSYVSDRENQTLTFSVVSGGGSFTGSVYKHTFDTLGTYTVTVQATDSQGKSSTATFTVVVPKATLAVVQEGDDLKLLDTGTKKFLTVALASGFTDTFKAALARGHVVYERTQGGKKRLFVYDPSTRKTTTLGDSADYDTTYAAKTSDDRVVYVKQHSASDTDLFVWNAVTGLVRTISAGVGQHDRNPFVNSADLVFYERGVNGQADVYYYDPTADTSTAVSTDANDEEIQGVTSDGAVVFTRVGGGGEKDLYWFKLGTGLVQIGSDLSATVQGQTKTYKGATTDGKVVFEVNAGTHQDLYMWDSATGTSRAIATTGVSETFAAVTPTNEVVYNVAASGTNNDLRIYTWSTNTDRAISTDGANDVYKGALSNGDVVFLRESGTGDDLYFYDTSASSTNALATAGADDYVFNKVLTNDKVVYTRNGASGGVYVIDTATLSVKTAGGPNSVYQGEATGGDFVVQTVVNSQKDLVLWDESAGAVVTISNATGDDAFSAALANGDVLFTRTPSGQSNKELFHWEAATSTTTQLTTATTLDHSVVATYDADNS